MIKSKKRATKENVMERIIEASMEIFASTFYDEASIRQIARKAGVGPATIYDYFPGKRELLLEIVTTKFKELTQQLQRDIRGIESPTERMGKLTWSYLNFFENNHNFARLLYYGIPMMAWAGSACWDLAREQGRIFANIVLEGQNKGSFRPDVDLHVMSSMYFGGLTRLMDRLVTSNWSLKLDQIAKEYHLLTLNGLTLAGKKEPI